LSRFSTFTESHHEKRSSIIEAGNLYIEPSLIGLGHGKECTFIVRLRRRWPYGDPRNLRKPPGLERLAFRTRWFQGSRPPLLPVKHRR
jgi:hypothetical protein